MQTIKRCHLHHQQRDIDETLRGCLIRLIAIAMVNWTAVNPTHWHPIDGRFHEYLQIESLHSIIHSFIH